MCVIVVVVVIKVVASNRKSKKKDGCEKASKLSSNRGRERMCELFLYFFHLFALDADVYVVLLCIYVCARIKQTNRRVSSTSLYICMSLDYLHIFHCLVSFLFFKRTQILIRVHVVCPTSVEYSIKFSFFYFFLILNI